jgi:glycosyltransferase involved in cell wall biosynthesis
MSVQRPLVSAIVLTYQFEDYLAESIDSVLTQDYPQDRLEVIVIDDGSTDRTPEVIEPYLDRVRYIRKPNGGLLSSVNRGFAEATGELLALQSGDDMWTPNKLARQVEILESRPEVGLLYGDMMVVDNDQQVLNPSFWAMSNITPRRGRPLGALMRGNFVSGGTLVVRAALRDRFHPLPAHAGWEDWWIATRVAEVAEIEYVSEPMLRYRYHGANMSLGGDAARGETNAAHEMPFRRWLLTDLALEEIEPSDLIVGCRLYEHCVVTAARLQGATSTRAVVPQKPDDAERLARHLKEGHEALARGDAPNAMRAAARAFGVDLHDARTRELFQTTCAALEREPLARSSTPAVASTTSVARDDASSRHLGASSPTRSRPRKPGNGRPRVTLGIATYDRDTYLAESISSALAQDYDDFEVLIVDDGSTNPAIAEVLAGFDDKRLRVVRHPENRGIAEGYNTMIREGRGELIAMVGDDDICLPGRLAREVSIFDAYPDTGVVHGDALIIDSDGHTTGRWESRDFTPAALIQAFFRSHNHLVDPTRMVHRRVYEAVGGYDSAYPIAQDMHFWLRAARDHRFRHCPGGPLVGFRRHGANTSDESAREREIDDVERALGEAIERYPLRELVPELDWAVLEPAHAERRALRSLADALEHRLLPLPRLAERLRARAARVIPPAPSPKPAGKRGRLMMTAFGWNDSGGGTTVPRLAAKELARRGWEVTVFHAATAPTPSASPYELVESEEDGVHLIGVHNRPSGIWDLGNPARELDDPWITTAFASALDAMRPDVVHFHNLHNLGAALIDQAASRGLPSYFSTHNYWLICPRAYLITGGGEICAGPGDGSACAACVHSPETDAHRVRLEGIRSRVGRGVNAILAVSEGVRRTLMGAGYPAETLDVVRQGMPHDSEIWERLGRKRVPGRTGERLTVAFLGSAYPHKGPQLLVEAAQRSRADVKVQIHGEISPAFAAQLHELDRREVVELCGFFQPSEIDRVLARVDVAALPSIWWDCAPLAAAECLAARVPLLVPRLGGLAEAVEDGVNGLLFEALDSGDLARCLDRLDTEDGLLESLQAQISPPRPFADYVDELESYYAGQRPGQISAPAPLEDLAVRWQGDHGRLTSLSIVNDRVTERLPVELQRVRRDGRALDPPLPHAADVEVRHQWPPDLSPPRSGRLAVIQPWEYGAIPREWIAGMRTQVDELWVPSEFVRDMYLAAGMPGERVVSLPNGVDLELFKPDGDRYPLPGAEQATRFLFVGGLIPRKGHDILLAAWRSAFAGREDVVLIIKGVGASDTYRESEREELLEYAASGELPRLILIEDDLDEQEMAGLFRACDVLVHPYRGEGFGMPVLEAMACGLPVIVTEGGPTDEFCPPAAGWRIRATRTELDVERVGPFDTLGHPWLLEPDADHLAKLLREAVADSAGRSRRGAAARLAAESQGWDRIATLYSERLAALASAPRRGPEIRSYRFEEDVSLRLLAAPAWHGRDGLAELLEQWRAATTLDSDACLYLLADPRVDGSQEELFERVLETGVDLNHAADVTVLMEHLDTDDVDIRLHASVDAFIALSDTNGGHTRIASATGRAVLSLDGGELAEFLSRHIRVGEARTIEMSL